jgi:hypothetical protein
MANALARVAGFLLVIAFPRRTNEEEETQVNMTVQCQFTVFGHRFAETDITAALGVIAILAVFIGLLLNTHGG